MIERRIDYKRRKIIDQLEALGTLIPESEYIDTIVNNLKSPITEGFSQNSLKKSQSSRRS
jgi:hypothetical protein